MTAQRSTCLLAEQLAARTTELTGEAFNFSNEIQVTVTQLVTLLLEQMDSNLQPVIMNEASNEIRHQYLSASKAKKLLGWEPLYTLDQGLRDTVAWYREFLA